MSSNDNNLIIKEAVSKFRSLVQQLITLHLKRQRDHIVRLRQRFITKLCRRLRENFVVYRRIRQQLEEDVVALTPNRAPRLFKQTNNRAFLNSFSTRIGSNFDDEQIETLRMDAETFRFLCGMLKPELSPGRAPQTAGVPLTLEMKVIIALYVLGTGADYRLAGKKFDVDFTTVRKCLNTFCHAMVKIFRQCEIRMPVTAAELDGVIKEFEDFIGIPQVMGIIDCLHVGINLPSSEPTQYINTNGWGSIVLQTVVDRHGRFMDIFCEHPGRSNDEKVLLESHLYPSLEEQEQPFDQVRLIDGKEVHPFLLGDEGYPLLPWLITPYLAGNLSNYDLSFNVYVSKARNVAATAFERLAGRWKVLNRCLHKDVTVVRYIVATCCILHNITERRDAPYRESWSECRSAKKVTAAQPQWTCGIVTAEGEELRHHLVKYMANNFPSIEDDY